MQPDTATSEMTVDTWGKLEQFLFKDALDRGIRRVCTKRAFRGLQKRDYRLSTKFQRRVAKDRRVERENAMIR